MAETLTIQQKAVVDDRGGTLLVSAAAGSGKTKVLVDRVMDRIQNEGKNINEFLIITFTNAAAAELRGKISAAISGALAKEPGNRHLFRQMNLLHLSQISTVHAFCGALLRQYGYLFDVPSDYRMLEDAQRENVLDRLLGDLLEERYTEMSPEFRLLADTLGAGRNDSALEDLSKSLFEKLLSQPYPEKWLQALPLEIEEDTELTQTLWGRILVENARRQLHFMIQRYDWTISLMTEDELLIPKYLPGYQADRAALAKMLDAFDGPWDAIAPALQMEYPSISARKYPDQDLLDSIKQVRAEGKKVLATLRGQFGTTAEALIAAQNQMAPALRALTELVGELYRRFSQEKRKKNLIDFSDQEHLAIALLIGEDGQPTTVAREVANTFAEIMVDEYQDSNRIQELIFTAISSGRDENRFLVGDVKQSIYGFRQAEPGIFLEKYQNYIPGAQAGKGQSRKLILSKNFRSRPEILEAVNHTFSSVMSPTVGDLTYGEEESLYPGLEEYPQDGQVHVSLDVLRLKALPQGRDDDSTKYQREAAYVAGRIVGLLNQGLPVRDGDGLRPVEPRDIAILFRSRDPMGIYQKALERAGVPVSSGSGGNLFETPEVKTLVALLKVLDNPHQDVPLLSVLCSPLFRISNDDLAAVRVTSSQARFYDAMIESKIEWCGEVLERLGELRELSQKVSAEALVWHLLQDTGLLASYSAMEGGADRRAHLLKIYELSQNFAEGSYLYLYELIRRLDLLAETGVETAQCAQGVVLTTIHKSKGLEYPVVFLCDLSRNFNFRELSDPMLVDGDDGIGARITDPERRIRYPGLCFNALKIKKRQTLLSEEMRILYVAMTRPKDYLFMTYAMGESDKTLRRLSAGASIPAAAWASSGAGSLGDWVLLSALSRIEAGELFAASMRPSCELFTSEYPWHIALHDIEVPEIPRYSSQRDQITEGPSSLPSPEQVVKALSWVYPHKAASAIPSKLTATQLKGRDKDTEVMENSAAPVSLTPLLRPDFLVSEGTLSPTEKGTATHLFLQYANFQGLNTLDGVLKELQRLEDQEFLTELQAEAVVPDQITKLFTSPLGKKMLSAGELIREFKFSLLTDAKPFYPEMEGEQLLLQGVVDAAIVEEDGITVIDFKTDRVTEQTISQRAEYYRPQLSTYREALERIFKKPVKATVLYFLGVGKEVYL